MGTYLEEYLDSIVLLPPDMKRNFDLMRELDEDAYSLMTELRSEQASYLKDARQRVRDLHASKEGKDPTEEEIKKVIENKEAMEKLLSKRQIASQKLDEKIAIASQTYDLVDHHIRRLDADLASYECLLRQSGDYDEEEIVRKRKAPTSQASDVEQHIHKKAGSATPLSRKTAVADLDVQGQEVGRLEPDSLSISGISEEQVIDPNEPLYCTCRRVSYGQMVACDNDSCKVEWFHYECVGLKEPPNGIWYCQDCISRGCTNGGGGGDRAHFRKRYTTMDIGPRKYKSILERQISRNKSEISLSAFSFLFSESVQYLQNRVQNISDLERKLDEMGYFVGVRLAELLSFREKSTRRETRLITMLQFIVSNCWKSLFGKAADALERSTENVDEYMIHENEPITNKFVSVPPDLGQLNCAAYIAGMVRGILDSGGFPARVTAHTVEMGTDQRDKTVFLVKFYSSVIERESSLS